VAVTASSMRASRAASAGSRREQGRGQHLDGVEIAVVADEREPAERGRVHRRTPVRDRDRGHQRRLRTGVRAVDRQAADRRVTRGVAGPQDVGDRVTRDELRGDRRQAPQQRHDRALGPDVARRRSGGVVGRSAHQHVELLLPPGVRRRTRRRASSTVRDDRPADHLAVGCAQVASDDVDDIGRCPPTAPQPRERLVQRGWRSGHRPTPPGLDRPRPVRWGVAPCSCSSSQCAPPGDAAAARGDLTATHVRVEAHHGPHSRRRTCPTPLPPAHQSLDHRLQRLEDRLGEEPDGADPERQDDDLVAGDVGADAPDERQHDHEADEGPE
jgi:hypothetical protein